MSVQLKILAKKHKRWIALVESMGCNKHESEDVVQDSYLKIHKYLEKGTNIDYGVQDVNDFYFYMTLRSVYLNRVNKNSVHNSSCEYDSDLPEIVDDYDYDKDRNTSELVSKIFSEINSWDFYDRNMFIAYFTTDYSYRRISKETGIGVNSIYNSTIKYKEIIYSMFKETYDEYLKTNKR